MCGRQKLSVPELSSNGDDVDSVVHEQRTCFGYRSGDEFLGAIGGGGESSVFYPRSPHCIIPIYSFLLLQKKEQ